MTEFVTDDERRDSPWQVRAGIVALSFGLIGLIGFMSLATRPTALASSAWWPAAGIAIGLGIQFPKARLWILAPLVAATTLPLALYAGRPVVVALALAVVVGIEMSVGVIILRGRSPHIPRLEKMPDLGRLLIAAAASAVTFAVLASLVDLIAEGPAAALERLETGAAKHAAGVLLITPLYMAMRRRRSATLWWEATIQIALTAATALYVFVTNPDLPLAFLPFAPLVWAAVRLSTRTLIIEMLATAVIASWGSATGYGPFSFERLGAGAGSLVLQIFEVSMVIVLLTLSLSVRRERSMTHMLRESEEIFRRNFDTSVAGMLILERSNDDLCSIVRTNGSAAGILTDTTVGTSLTKNFSPEALSELATAADAADTPNSRLRLDSNNGRSLDVSLSYLGSHGGNRIYAMQFLDITEVLEARKAQLEELERAAQVQRALAPLTLPDVPHWAFSARSIPARQVGGDFYDVRVSGRHGVITLGDVMGKGVGSGMLAASTRTALRLQADEESPATALARTADLVQEDFTRAEAFVTLAHCTINFATGELSLVDAGHGLIFVTRRAGGSVERLASTDPPLGISEAWHDITTRIESGDTLILLSDGLLDLWDDKIENIEAELSRLVGRETPAEHILDVLCAGADQTVDRDDITAVVVTRR
ncbi:hypothetical protein GCM10009808_17950 [Microbacterium sediminicola]|uniref:PPM-type phosphatase domain-containing protein n=1 Tax=Microbacterium sediminicola TaxID=415210 RepID=A0ABN2I8Y4_9MICO